MKHGSLYTILRRMEHSGILESEWEKEPSHLDRRVYQLSELGLEKLREGKDIVEEQRRVLDEVIEFFRDRFEGDELDDRS